MRPFLSDVRFWLYLAAWLPYVTFVFRYAFFSPWYATPLGRSLLLSKGVIALLLTHALLIVALGRRYPGASAVQAVIVGGVIAAGWFQLITLLRLQRQARSDRPKTKEKPRAPILD